MVDGRCSEIRMLPPASRRPGNDLAHLLVTRDGDNHLARFALEVTSMPVYDGQAMMRGLSHRQWMLALLVAQANFLVAIRSARYQEYLEPPRLQLRMSTSGDVRVKITLFGSVTDSSERRACWLADDLIDEIVAAFPPEFGLALLAQPDLRSALSGPFDMEACGWWGCEIRRRTLPIDLGSKNPQAYYLPCPFGWLVDGSVSLVRAMAARQEPAVLGVTLHPTLPTDDEIAYLNDLRVGLYRAEAAVTASHGVPLPLLRAVSAHCILALSSPFVMHVQLAGKGAPAALIGAVARSVSGIPDGYVGGQRDDLLSMAAYYAGVDVVFPQSEEEWNIYRRNLFSLDVARWGEDSDPVAFHRLRYLTDALGATSCFRVPILPPTLAEDVGMELASI